MTKKAIFDKKNVLVIGGAGFIGSHLCDELIKDAKVICIDNFSTGQEKNIDHLLANPDFEFINHDMSKDIFLENFPELQKFKIEFQGVQEIYNLACPMSIKNFNRNKIETLLANSYVIKNSLDLAIKYNARFLHFSSSVVYGLFDNFEQKISEDYIGKIDHLSDRAVYDEGKKFAETMVVNYREEYGIDAKIIRVFRIYGPRMPLNDEQMIPDFIINALDGKDLNIHGDENFSSSFCYISDCIDASIKMMQSKYYGPINIGSDVKINLTTMAGKIINITKSNSKINYTKEVLFMKPLCLPDLAKSRNELGWLPIVTLDTGLNKTIDDLRAKKGLIGL
jgi:UDP-glucuronate decarboxylase